MRRFLFVIVGLTFSTSSVSSMELEGCSNIEADTERLACYDSFLRHRVDPSDDPEPEMASNWIFVEDRDEFSGADTSYVFLDSDQAGNILTGAPISMVVRCDGSGGSEIYVLSGGYIGGTRERVPVRYKFAEGETIVEQWSESTNGKAAFLPSGYRDFVTGLRSGESFVFEITNYRGSRFIANFPSGGDVTLLQHIFDGCPAGQ